MLPATSLSSVAEASAFEESIDVQLAAATSAAAAVRNSSRPAEPLSVPAHVTAAQSIAALAAMNVNGHGGQRNGSGRLGKFIDRMPRRARGRPLPKVFCVLVNTGDSKPWEHEPSARDRDEYVWLRAEQASRLTVLLRDVNDDDGNDTVPESMESRE